jgi:hypothetical protein
MLHRLEHSLGCAAYVFYPTLCWLDSSDLFLKALTLGGMVASLPIIFGVCTGPALLLSWLLYLSIINAGIFFQFQLDMLLLEAGFFSIFLVPWRWVEPPLVQAPYPYSNWILWILRLLLFKLMFCSGIVKLCCDPVWRNLTALYYYFETQPLPNVVAWYAHQLPHWLQRFCAGSTLLIELIVPFFIFGPCRFKLIAGILFCFLQGLISLTGNYGFFNLLSAALSILLFDDTAIKRFTPRTLNARFVIASPNPIHLPKQLAQPQQPYKLRHAWQRMLRVLMISCVGCIILISIGQFWQRWGGTRGVPVVLGQLISFLKPFHIINNYGLFSTMNKYRSELVLQGSNDLKKWKTYDFVYKPGELQQPPPTTGLIFPRLDWWVTFAAYAKQGDEPWFKRFITKLFEGSPAVLALLENNPFPIDPPTHIRANLYIYRFTSFQERQSTGNWWKRTLVKAWCYSRADAISLRQEHM